MKRSIHDLLRRAVSLILCDGCKLTLRQGICLNRDHGLAIYCQSGGTGTLNAEYNDRSDARGHAVIGDDMAVSAGYAPDHVTASVVTADSDGRVGAIRSNCYAIVQPCGHADRQYEITAAGHKLRSCGCAALEFGKLQKHSYKNGVCTECGRANDPGAVGTIYGYSSLPVIVIGVIVISAVFAATWFVKSRRNKRGPAD